MLRHTLLAMAGSLAFAVPVSAATPESGQVTDDGKQMTWQGEAAGYGIGPINSLAGGGLTPCEQPYCDAFTLEVKAGGKLTIQANDTNNFGFTDLYVIQPGGEAIYNGGEDAMPTTVVIDNAKPGSYTVETSTNDPVGLGAPTRLAHSWAPIPLRSPRHRQHPRPRRPRPPRPRLSSA